MCAKLLWGLVLWVALLGGSYLPYHLILPVRIAHHVLITVLLALVLWRWPLPSSVFNLPAALMILAVLTAAAHALDPRMGIEYAWHWITNMLLALLVFSWSKEHARTLFNAHFTVLGLSIAICLFQATADPLQRPGGVFGLVNLTGGYIAALALPAIIRQPRWRWVWALGVGAALLANQSRGALLALAVGIVVFAALRGRWRPALAAAALLLTVGVGLSTHSGRVAGDSLRLDLWRAAERMTADYPFGVGPGLFGLAYPSYRAPRFATEDGMTGAHNLYINLAAELGGPGIAAGLALGLALLYSLASAPRDIEQDASLAALVGVGAHMLFDNFPSANYALLVALLAGTAMRPVPNPIELPWPAVGRAIQRQAVLLLLIYGAQFAVWDYAQTLYERGLRGDEKAAQQAAVVDPALALYQVHPESLTPTSALIMFGRYWQP